MLWCTHVFVCLLFFCISFPVHCGALIHSNCSSTCTCTYIHCFEAFSIQKTFVIFLSSQFFTVL